MSKTTYLVVKTGKSGAKLNDLYSVSVDGVKLTGEHRLQGGWYQSIVRTVKEKGGTGTFTIFKHKRKDAEVLLKNYQKSMLMLRNDIKWIPVARVDMEERNLEKVVESARIACFEDLANKKIIEIIKRDPFTYRPAGMKLSDTKNPEVMNWRERMDYNLKWQRITKVVKLEVNLAGAAAMFSLVKMV
ncbi:MAG: hypothetical protein NTX31_03840 [Burkholderiales bacterium]|nr:hypothetical protein [Burkholderiales bacterium]